VSAKHGLVGLHKLVSVNRFEDRYKTQNLLTYNYKDNDDPG
jgi:hypothetical protein